jgi:tripartite ATP-independent transporter DctP family solute receptor
MTTRRAFGLAALLTAGALALPAAAQDVTLRFAHYGSPTDSVTAAGERFAALVSEKTDGAVAIEIFPAGELGNSPTMLEGVRLGTIDIVTVGNPFFTGVLPQLNALDLPFLFQSDAHAFAVLDGEVGQELMGSMSEAGMQGLAFWELGFRNLTNSVRPVTTPADLEGLKLRTTPNPAHVLAFETMGANPTPMPFAEVYSALQTGTIDGQENPVNHIHANKLDEVQGHMSLTRHAYTTSPLVMNRARWASLSEDQQTALREAALEAAAYQRQINDEEEITALDAMKAGGMQVVEEPDVDAFRDAVSDVTRAAYVEQFGEDVLSRIDAAAQ